MVHPSLAYLVPLVHREYLHLRHMRGWKQSGKRGKSGFSLLPCSPCFCSSPPCCHIAFTVSSLSYAQHDSQCIWAASVCHYTCHCMLCRCYISQAPLQVYHHTTSAVAGRELHLYRHPQTQRGTEQSRPKAGRSGQSVLHCGVHRHRLTEAAQIPRLKMPACAGRLPSRQVVFTRKTLARYSMIWRIL